VAGVAGSASVNGDTLTITAVNTSLGDAAESTIRLVGGTVASATGTVLSGPDIHAHNDFAGPDRVKPGPLDVKSVSGGLQVKIPAASVVKISAKLG
jgi:alpha-N-arabinofuranosidase